MKSSGTKQIRTKWLTIRLSNEEEKKLKIFFSYTTAGSLSNYARNILLNKPVTLKFRNESLDDFMEELLLLKKELNAIGVNVNQAVHRLHTMDRLPEIKDWLTRSEEHKNLLENKYEEIKSWMNKLAELWSQE